MTTRHATRKTISSLIVIAFMMVATTTAQADWLSPAFYGDELDRCATELRAELDLTDVSYLRHDVTRIDKVGVWYVFDIRSEMADETDTVIGRVKTRCKAHRWRTLTVADIAVQSVTTVTQLASAD